MTGTLLDTNVPSELVKPLTDPAVRTWVEDQPYGSMHLSVITIGELRRGIEILDAGRKRASYEHWLYDDLIPDFEDRLLPVTQAVAEQWAVLEIMAKRKGTILPVADGLIAATAVVHGLTLVTRNVRHFQYLVPSIINPWGS